MQADGNLVIYGPDAEPLWASGTHGQPGSHLVVQDDGNAVIYRPDGVPIWATHTMQRSVPTGPRAEGNDMQPSEVLNPGNSIKSADARYTFIYQWDGNLVLYRNSDGKALWASGTYGKPVQVCIMQTDGNLVIYGPDGEAIWASGTYGHPGSRLVVQNDGKTVILDANNREIWNSQRRLEIPFAWGTNNLSFSNFARGAPSWETFETTFRADEVWHEILDPIFGHPILTAAYYEFYKYFLKGVDNGGLATGFCTSMAALVADNLWTGRTDTHSLTEDGMRTALTAVHGRLLSKESLLAFHDQGLQGIDRVERSCREIEATFLRGCSRENAPLLFFIPSGEVWDSGYFDKLSRSHCVMPWRFVYPVGHPGPQLSADRNTTIHDLDGVQLYVWDCNRPESKNCRLVFKRNAAGKIEFDYFPDSPYAQFSFIHGITLGMMSNGNYQLADHDLPFTGPVGLTSFIIDFLLSPADMQITDANGLRTGNFDGQIRAEIPGSHPCYLLPRAYLLPSDTPLTRRITGTGTGTYTFNSITPNGGSVVLKDVTTSHGQVDTLVMSADGTKVRFTPGQEKKFAMIIARRVGEQARAMVIDGIGGGPDAEVDVTMAPDLSSLRISNRGAEKSVEVRACVVDSVKKTPANRTFAGVRLPSRHDLMVSVPDWSVLDARVETAKSR